MAIFMVSPNEQAYAKDFGDIVTIQAEGSDDETDIGEGSEPSVDEVIEERIYEDLKKGGYELDNTNDISDKNLYSALMQIVKQYIKDTYDGYVYSDTTLWTTMLKNVESVTIENMDITSLSGIEKIRFDSLKSLTIVGNDFSSIPNNFFDRMGVLEQLDLSNNKLSTIEFPSNSTLTKINLSSNNLSKVNFSQLKNVNLDINLANNRFSSITNIGFSTRLESLNMNIINNNIMDITDDYFTNPKISLNIGLQGIVSNNGDVTIDTSQSINFYKLNKDGVFIKFYKIGTISDTFVKTVADGDIADGNYIALNNFAVGEYYAEYYDESGQLYVRDDSEKSIYKTYRFSVIPSEVKVQYEFKGKIYDTFDNKVTGKVKVLLSCEDGGEIYYRVGNSDWTKGSEINCDNGGNYSIVAKVVIDGIESNEKAILVRTSLNVVVPDILMLILILLFTLALFLIVVPFISKKWFRK